jgi:hypothetical protein
VRVRPCVHSWRAAVLGMMAGCPECCLANGWAHVSHGACVCGGCVLTNADCTMSGGAGLMQRMTGGFLCGSGPDHRGCSPPIVLTDHMGPATSRSHDPWLRSGSSTDMCSRVLYDIGCLPVHPAHSSRQQGRQAARLLSAMQAQGAPCTGGWAGVCWRRQAHSFSVGCLCLVGTGVWIWAGVWHFIKNGRAFDFLSGLCLAWCVDLVLAVPKQCSAPTTSKFLSTICSLSYKGCRGPGLCLST